MTDFSGKNNVYYSALQYNSSTAPVQAEVDVNLVFPLLPVANQYQVAINKCRVDLSTIPLTKSNVPFHKYQVGIQQPLTIPIAAAAYVEQIGTNSNDYVFTCSPTGLVTQNQYTSAGVLTQVSQTQLPLASVQFFCVDDYSNLYAAGNVNGGLSNVLAVYNIVMGAPVLLTLIPFTQIRGLSIAINQRVYVADESSNFGSGVYVFSNVNSIGNVSLTEIAILSEDVNGNPLGIIQTVSADNLIVVGTGVNTINLYNGSSFQCYATYVEPSVGNLGAASAIISTLDTFAVSDKQIDNFDIVGWTQTPVPSTNASDVLTGAPFFGTLPAVSFVQWAGAFVTENTSDMFYYADNGPVITFNKSVYNPSGGTLGAVVPVIFPTGAASISTPVFDNHITYLYANLGLGGTSNLLGGLELGYVAPGNCLINADVANTNFTANGAPKGITFLSDKSMVMATAAGTLFRTNIPAYPRVMYIGGWDNGVAPTYPYQEQYGWEGAWSSTVVNTRTTPAQEIVFATCKLSSSSPTPYIFNLTGQAALPGNLPSPTSVTTINPTTLAVVTTFPVTEFYNDWSSVASKKYGGLNILVAGGFLYIPSYTKVFMYNAYTGAYVLTIDSGATAISDPYIMACDILFISASAGITNLCYLAYGVNNTLGCKSITIDYVAQTQTVADIWAPIDYFTVVSTSTVTSVKWSYGALNTIYLSVMGVIGASGNAQLSNAILTLDGVTGYPTSAATGTLYGTSYISDDTFIVGPQAALGGSEMYFSGADATPYFGCELYIILFGANAPNPSANYAVDVYTCNTQSLETTLSVPYIGAQTGSVIPFLFISADTSNSYALTPLTNIPFGAFSLTSTASDILYITDSAGYAWRASINLQTNIVSTWINVSTTPYKLLFPNTFGKVTGATQGVFGFSTNDQSAVGSHTGGYAILGLARNDVEGQFLITDSSNTLTAVNALSFNTVFSVPISPTINGPVWSKNGTDIDAGPTDIYSMDVLIGLINAAIARVWTRLGNVTVCPVTLSLDYARGFVSIAYPAGFTSAGGNGLYFNDALLQLITFPSTKLTLPSTPPYPMNLLVFDSTTAGTITQTSKTIYLFNQLDKLLFISNTIYVAGSVIGNNSTNNVITDIDVPTNSAGYMDNVGQTLYYQPGFLRVFQMASSNPLQRIQITLAYSYLDGSQHNLMLAAGQGWSAKVQFPQRF